MTAFVVIALVLWLVFTMIGTLALYSLLGVVGAVGFFALSAAILLIAAFKWTKPL